MPPLVSAIIPVYNGERYIRSALNCALSQTHSPYEVIVVDDASTDRTAEILREYAGAIRVIRRETNSGICEVARTAGIEAAGGKYVAFLDVDDLWYLEKIGRQAAFMEAHPEFPLSHTYMNIVDQDGVILGVRHEGGIPPSGPCAVELLKHCFITVSAIMVRKEVWLEAGVPALLEDFNSDLDYYFPILRRHPAGFGFLPEVLGAYRKWQGGVSQTDWKTMPANVVTIDRSIRRGDCEGLIPPRLARSILADACLRNAGYHRGQGAYGRAMYYCIKALGAVPLRPAAYGELVRAMAGLAVPLRLRRRIRGMVNT